MSNLTAKELFGCMTALVTPMDERGEINYDQWKNMIQHQVNAKINAIVVAGTTGESSVLSEHEFEKLLSQAVAICDGSTTKVIAQTGAIDYKKVISRNNIAHDIGACSVLVVTPYYLRTTQEGLFAHYSQIADVSNLPIILYNVPSRTHNDLSVDVITKLSRHKMIIGIKEASTKEHKINNIVQLTKNNDFNVLSGNDDTFLQALSQGARGVISVASNLRPVSIKEIVDLNEFGDSVMADTLNTGLDNLYKVLSCQPNPIPVKYLLHASGIIDKGIRLPLVWFDKNTAFDFKSEILNTIKEYSKI